MISRQGAPTDHETSTSASTITCAATKVVAGRNRRLNVIVGILSDWRRLPTGMRHREVAWLRRIKWVRLRERLSQSVYTVLGKASEVPSSQGSAVAISTREAVTNCHVVSHGRTITLI